MERMLPNVLKMLSYRRCVYEFRLPLLESADKKVRRQNVRGDRMICEKTLKECMADYTYDILQCILQDKNIEEEQGLSHEAMCERIASHMLKKEELERYVSCLSDDEIERMEKEISYDLEHGTREGCDTIPMLLCQGEYAFRYQDDFDDPDVFWLPKDVAEACLSLKTEEFAEKRAKKNRFLSCLMAVGAFYGKIPLSVIAPLMEIDADEISNVMEELPMELNHYMVHEGILYHRELYWECGGFLEDQEECSYYIPDEKELEELGRLGYLASRAEMRALVGYLVTEQNMETEPAEYAAMWVQKMIAANGCLEDVYQYLRDFGIIDGEVPGALSDLMKAFQLSTRRLKYRGFSEFEFFKIKPADILEICQPIVRYIV